MNIHITREEAALAILGEQPGVRLTDELGVTAGDPWAVVATLADDAEMARAFALELLEDIQLQRPCWRGWSLEFGP